MSAKGNAINSEAALCRSLLRGVGVCVGAHRFRPLANFAKNLFIVVNCSEHRCLYYDMHEYHCATQIIALAL